MSEEDKDERDVVLRCLDMVLRVCGSKASDKGKERARLNADEIEELAGESEQTRVIRRLKVWNVRNSVGDKIQGEKPLWPLIQLGSEKDNHRGKLPSFYPVQITPGPLRRPPNVYDSTVHASLTPSPIPFPACSQPSFSISHPSIPTCSMLLNILPPATCESIIETANTLGWEQDQAAGGSAVDKTSVLAHNVVWLADEEFVGELFNRIKPFVEAQIGGSDEKGDGQGGKVRGINRRFRVYRYGPRQVYRPHIDGAWPAAGIDPKTGEYMHDSSPSDDPLWSRYTLLIYLNSDINNTAEAPTVPGATTFFLPHPESIGTLLACPIAPVQGAVLVFPHGDARGSLLHEGSPVGDGGWKVVIRTDLLYEAEGFGEFAPGKKRKLVIDADADEERGVSKIAKVVSESVGPDGKTEMEVIVPKAVGVQNMGDGLEGAGG